MKQPIQLLDKNSGNRKSKVEYTVFRRYKFDVY